MPYRVTVKPDGGPVREVFRTGFAIVAVRFLMRLTGVTTAERYELDPNRRARFVVLNQAQAERYLAANLQKGTGSHCIITRRTVYRAERCPPYGAPSAEHKPAPLPGYPRGPVDLTKLTKAPHDKTRAVSEPGRLGHFKGAA